MRTTDDTHKMLQKLTNEKGDEQDRQQTRKMMNEYYEK
jgi:hypothetical protein